MESVRCPYRRDDRFLRAKTEGRSIHDKRPRRPSRRPVVVVQPIISQSLVRRRLTIH
jgi:hypothetical protein